MQEEFDDNNYKENYIASLHTDIVDTVKNKMTPMAMRYQYSQIPLEEKIKWRPVVLILGNYSSGKSTLINEFLGYPLQATGQAPTDDSFTVITYKENSEGGDISVDERDGKVLLNDQEFPFKGLKEFGQRFSSHFRLKRLNVPVLKNLALIDTPGMLDSVAERDRGYDYQKVVSELAQIADLILILFDPHKAGTIKETYQSLRETLPKSTYEDRMIFVLNRIDECNNFMDLLQVYGTLCWNLSQMTGRKDIPTIHLTYSKILHEKSNVGSDFLSLVENQRVQIKKRILMAPKYRLDHLATYVEEHSEKMIILLSVLKKYKWLRRKFLFSRTIFGFIASIIGGVIVTLLLGYTNFVDILPISGFEYYFVASFSFLLFFLWLLVMKKLSLRLFHKRTLNNIDELFSPKDQSNKERWDVVRVVCKDYLIQTRGSFSFRQVKKDENDIKQFLDKVNGDVRQALSEISYI